MMREYSPDHIILVSAIENGNFDRASEILARDDENRYIYPVGPLEVTALQVAAWQGRMDLLDQLYEKGADVNVVDKIGRCALYYAAHCGYAQVTKWLLQREAYVDPKVGINSCTMQYTTYHCSLQSNLSFVGKNLPSPICLERTPLHQAVKNNHARVVHILVEAGADVNAKDEHLITPLLLAGSAVNRDDPEEMTKFNEIVKSLVSAKAFLNVIHPDTGTTALHHAAVLGSATATRTLLSNGAWPMFKCKSSGSTPLHIAASKGNTETLVALLETMQPHRIDTRDQLYRTALHRSAYQGHRECVRILINYKGSLAATTKTGVTVVDAIFSHIPRPLNFLTEILDSCVRTTNNNNLEKYESITLDFSMLAPKYQMQMAVVTALIAAASNVAELEILQHPLVETFLRLKWAKLRIFFFLLVLVHIFFVISLSIYAIMLIKNDHDYVLNRRVLMICSCILLLHNVIQVLLEPRHYLRQYEIWLSFICGILSLVASIAGESVKYQCPNETYIDAEENLTQRRCGQWILHCLSVTILLGWIQMMLLVGRFPMWGYYALMYSTVLKNMLKVLLAFGYLIVGFSLSFAVLFHGNKEFHDFWRAVVRTVIMMMGEYEYENLFKNEDEGGILPITSRIVFFIFTMLASIVLINLMIGLAVNDIQGLEKEGHIRRLLKQAEFVAHLERVTSHRIFRSNWLHPRLRRLLHSNRDIPTKITLSYRGNYSHPVNHLMELTCEIPVELKEALFQLAMKTSFENKLADKNIDDTKLTSMISNIEEQLSKWRTRLNTDLMINRRSTKRRGARKNLHRKML